MRLVPLQWRLAVAAGVAILAAAIPIAQTPGEAITIRAGQVFDGRGGVARDILIEVANGKITRVGRGTGRATYELPSLTLMPGWIDTHVHIGAHFNKTGRYDNQNETPAERALYGAENAWSTLASGFTTVQSVGEAADADLRAAIARGILPGPRILTSITQITERTGGSGGATLASPDQLREAVRQAKTAGADLIKLFASASIRDGGKQTMTD